MSARKQARDVLNGSQVTQLLDLQRELLSVVALGGSLRERLDRTCLLFEQAVEGMVATVMELDPEGVQLHFISAPSAPKELLAELDHARIGDGHGSCAYAAWSNEATYVGDALEDPHWEKLRDVASTFGVRACWSAPVHDREGETLGTFALTSLHARLPDDVHRQLLDLGAQSIGLMFVQEREHIARESGARALHRLALVADTTPNGILFTDASGNIEWSNASARTLLEKTLDNTRKYELHEILGRQPDDRDMHFILDAIRSGSPHADTLFLEHASGSTWVAQLTCTPRHDGQGRLEGAVVMLVDVTPLQRLSEFNALLARVDNALSRHTDPARLLQEICDLAVLHTGLSLAWIGRPDPETGWFHPLAAAGPGRDYLDEVRISSRRDLPEGRGPCGATWNDGRSRFDGSFEHDADLKPWAKAAHAHGFAAIAVLPIHRSGELWAELCVYHSELHSFDESLQQLMETLALNISSGLDRIDLAHREREIQALNQSMLESATVGVVLTRDRTILRANRRAADILGATGPDALVGLSTIQFYADADTGKHVATSIAEAFEAGRRAILEVAIRRLDDRVIWLRLEGAPFHHEGYDEIWSLIDQTEQHEAIKKQLLLADALASVQEGVIITDAEQNTVYTNTAFEALTGYGFEQMRGRNCRILQGPESDRETIARMHDALNGGHGFTGEILNYRLDGSRFWNLLTINPIRDAQGAISHYVGVQRDITDLRQLNERLEHLAFHDELTGLPNRRALDRYFADTLPETCEANQVLALAIIDLDDFKIINDTHGHACGDLLLRTVTERVRPLIDNKDFFARLGGDEFVIAFHDTKKFRFQSRLRKRIATIGNCFREPFDIGTGTPIHMGLSMGVALCPKHARVGGMLLRLADEALFKAKEHKLDRAQWWSIHGDTDGRELDVAIPAYGTEAAEVLDKARPYLIPALEPITDNHYAQMQSDAQAKHWLHGLDRSELAELKQQEIEHMRLLLSGDLTRQALTEASRQLGRIHALIGMDSVLLMRWISASHDSLSAECNRIPINARYRYHMVQLLDHRLQDDLQARLEVQTAVRDRYAAIIDQYMPDRGVGWNDAIGLEIRLLARLPGISCAMVLRQNGQESYNIESSAGASARQAARVLRECYGNPKVAQIRPPDESLIARCWHRAESETVANLGLNQDDDGQLLPRALSELGLRSAACIPVFDEQHLPVAVLLLLGSYPNQFESKYMRHFTRNLQLRGNEIWQRSMRPPPPVPHELAVAYRRRLFKDGLRILMQPVVDLDTGRMIKIEALARLKLENGEVLGPDVFLPLLRHNELDTLFQHGLDLALAELVELDRQGLELDLALNIAPYTLAEPACREWVEKALNRHGIEPHRLVLEVLENQRVDRKPRDTSVRHLIELGVRFAIDDLGSGYSSLRRLASLPFHAVKVDQDLLARLYRDPVQSVSLISAVVQIGRDFGCQVIAEGLEDQGMIEVARLLGAHLGQGYAIARPMPASELAAWNRDFDLGTQANAPQTPLGALAFQWISVRHGSLHPENPGDCPLNELMTRLPGYGKSAKQLHAAVHDDPQDEESARRLLDWMQDSIRSMDGPETA